MRAAVILAGGLSSRMGGGYKPLLELNNGTILSYVSERLSKQADQIAINANGAINEFSQFNCPVIQDLIKGHLGPLAGIHAAMTWGKKIGARDVLTVAGDTPFFPKNLYDILESQRGDTKIAMASTGTSPKDRHPTFALWPCDLAPSLEGALQKGVRKLISFSDPYGVKSVIFSQDQNALDPFFNINTPADLEEAKRRLKS